MPQVKYDPKARWMKCINPHGTFEVGGVYRLIDILKHDDEIVVEDGNGEWHYRPRRDFKVVRQHMTKTGIVTYE